MLSQFKKLGMSWTDPKPCPPVEDDRDGCLGSMIKMALVGTVFMAVVAGAAAKVTSSWLQEQGINKPPAEPIAVNIGTGTGKLIPVTLIPANDAAADVVNGLEKSRQSSAKPPRSVWSG